MEKIRKIREWVLIFGILPLAFFDRLNIPIIPVVNSTHGLLKVLIVLSFGSFLAEKILKRDFKWINTFFMSGLLLFLTGYTLTIFYSVEMETSLKSAVYYFVGVGMMLMYADLVNKENMKKMVMVWWWLMVVSLLIKMVWLFFPETYLEMIRGLLNNDSYWFVSYLLSIGRLHVWDMTVYTVFLLAYLVIFSRSTKGKIATGILLMGEIFFVVLSASRTYLVTTALGMVAMLGVAARKGKEVKKSRWLMGALLVVLFGGLVYSQATGMEGALTRVEKTFENGSRLSGRIDWGVEAWWQFSQRPWLGTGQNTYSMLAPVNSKLWNMRFVEYMSKNGYSGAYAGPTGHSLMTYLSETGIIGFGLLLMIWGYFMLTDIKYLTRKEIGIRQKMFYMVWAIPSGWLFPLVNITDTPGAFEILMFFIFRGVLLASDWKRGKGIMEV